ncbi:retron St85 family RNA-directed DNA polymerase [Streptococcus suis]|uniref:retron St85 family RNA-directed DNA polymerase n=1 Tax=Streptococcus suis TaxID=1307 RepID=UPI00209ABABA|nr:retron St85 family RNA-directed DNA polymerase [Streptococcus suis]MCO8189146.1 retron St85 family RNA-directed DNA polymerase [Streptococcus suis]MCO8205558.1 retron St85 family RNA-directed DNA polymerase [Streptococcus suis]MCO8213416.1 retron St85 family RNA-directed DNA polymerase [Streptococcus suis]MCO8230989.1 retron St85 family RNA-directed DNA polymerase [Streptococcus suis]MCO8239296.1 retron St85 family RNA-directed DNA polymerase [Streptococcus suis]
MINWTEETIADYKNRLIEKGVPVIFDIEHFRRLLGIKKSHFYKLFYGLKYQYKLVKIPKRKIGEYRELTVPSKNIKKIQRWILEFILYSNLCDDCVTGFIPTKSIVENALPHLGHDYIYKFDLKDFFPSIPRSKVFYLFKNLGYTAELSNYLASFCCYNDSLPQGAPTSPYIANLICKRLDNRLKILCERNGFTYTRYADDITVSGDFKIVHFRNLFETIIEDSGFTINELKTKLIRNGQRKIVTGVVVNEKPTISRDYIRELKKEIYFINKFGIENHMNRIGEICSVKDYRRKIFGKINFVKMVDRELGLELRRKVNPF